MNRNEELEAMLSIAREASAIVARVYATNFAVDYKGPADPVTQADREFLAQAGASRASAAISQVRSRSSRR